MFLIIAESGQRTTLYQIAAHELAATAFGDVLNAVLRLDALVDVGVPRQHEINLVFDKERVQLIAHTQIGRVHSARRKERVVHEGDFPPRF